MPDTLAVDQLTVEYGRVRAPLRALAEVTFDVPTSLTGASLVVVGASGAGKSTLGLAILGLLPITARVRGTVTLPGGVSLGDAPERLREYRRTNMGAVFQDAPGSLIPGVTIGRQLERVYRLRRRTGRRNAACQAKAALADVGLTDHERIWRARPLELSGGMCQRISICMGPLAAPQLRVIIADEPTSNLDTVSAAQVLDLLFRIQRERGVTMLFITHDVRLVARFEWVAVLAEGRLVEFQKSHGFLSAPKSEEGRRLLAASKSLGQSESVNT